MISNLFTLILIRIMFLTLVNLLFKISYNIQRTIKRLSLTYFRWLTFVCGDTSTLFCLKMLSLIFISRYLDSNNLQNLTAGVFSSLTTLTDLYVGMTYQCFCRKYARVEYHTLWAVAIFPVFFPVASFSSLAEMYELSAHDLPPLSQ